MLCAECLEHSINVHETCTLVFKKNSLDFRNYLKVTKTKGRRKIISFSEMKCKGIGGEIILAGRRRIFVNTRDVCRSVHDLVKLPVLETLPKQNWEVNHILVNPASFSIALWECCILCSTGSMLGLHCGQWCFIAPRKCCGAGVNCSFSSSLLHCIPLLQCKYQCAPHHSSPQNSVTEFYLGRTCCPASHILGHIQSNSLTTRGRVDPLEQCIISIACCPRLGTIIKSCHILILIAGNKCLREL